ncbi:MAG: hypothetical protein ACOYBL_06905 [Lachnospiraceae bacterium]|jgi:hypothetical protein
MKKKVLALALMMLLLVTTSLTVYAEDRQGASGWQVTFDGKKMDSNFTNANMDDEIYNMQPGDSVELTIALKNTYNGQADWYMKNQVLEALEDAGDISGGAYDYLLTYIDSEGTVSTLYSSEKFGGEGRYNGVGLHGATTTLDDYFYLDRLGDGETGTVKLKVALDGQTQGNAYQNTLASLQMNFATELVQAGSAGSTPGTQDSSQQSTRPVKTGDQSNVILYICLTLGAGLVLLLLAVMRLRNDRKEEQEVASGASMDRENTRTERRRRK